MRVGDLVTKRNAKKCVGLGVVVEVRQGSDGENAAVVRWGGMRGTFQYKTNNLESAK
jgi:hypothetical protein